MKTLHTLVLGLVLAFGGAARAISVDEAIEMMVGNYRETATNLHIARVSLDHTDDAVYAELIVAGAEREVRQMILTFHETDEGVNARVYAYFEPAGDEFAQDLKLLTIGLWAAPDLFPKLKRGQLDAVADIPLVETSEGLRLEFERAPVALYGAHFLECDLLFAQERVEWKRIGRVHDGEDVWREDVVLPRVEIEPPVTRFDNGLVTIDIRKGSGVSLQEGDQIAFNYIGVLDDGRRFDSTYFEGRGLYAGPFPGGIHPEMARGMIGLECPTAISDENLHKQPIRKVILPPEIGFGAERVGPIPGNSTVYFLALVESVRDRTPDEPVAEDE